MGRRWAALIMGSLLTIGAVGVANAGRVLVAADETAASDVTLVTYAVNARREVLEEAARRYASGETRYVVVGALRTESGYDEPLAEAAARAEGALLSAGVPGEAVLRLPQARGEAEEAENVGREAEGRAWRRLLAYTLEQRALRTRLALRRVLAPAGVEVRVGTVRGAPVAWERWWATAVGREAVRSEYGRLVYYAFTRRV